jgi:hypothetical protein
MKKHTITNDDYIKAVKKADREREIEQHGKQISTRPTRIHKVKTEYNRKKFKSINIDDE